MRGVWWPLLHRRPRRRSHRGRLAHGGEAHPRCPRLARSAKATDRAHPLLRRPPRLARTSGIPRPSLPGGSGAALGRRRRDMGRSRSKEYPFTTWNRAGRISADPRHSLAPRVRSGLGHPTADMTLLDSGCGGLDELAHNRPPPPGFGPGDTRPWSGRHRRDGGPSGVPPGRRRPTARDRSRRRAPNAVVEIDHPGQLTQGIPLHPSLPLVGVGPARGPGPRASPDRPDHTHRRPRLPPPPPTAPGPGHRAPAPAPRARRPSWSPPGPRPRSCRQARCQ